MKRNPHLERLTPNYIFRQVQMRKESFQKKNPGVEILSLGVGDTSEPLPLKIAKALGDYSYNLGTKTGYSGYGPEEGNTSLREKIASTLYHNKFSKDEIFISDGANCDIGRLQLLFGHDISIAVQDPAYPAYLEGSILQGVTHVIKMNVTPENNFFPDLENTPRTDLIYFCTPLNPTGTATNRLDLKRLVDFALRNKSILIVDSAYSAYVQSSDVPYSIYEIEGAEKVAIEIGTFSKWVGFTGVRLGWTVVPETLRYDSGQSVRADWLRIVCTIFNGASNIAQAGGEIVLTPEGLEEGKKLIAHYHESAHLLRVAFKKLGLEYYGGVDAPYIWVRRSGMGSWESFDHFLEKYQIVTTPGIGFGPSGEGFVRFSALSPREVIIKAIERLKK